MQPKWIDEVAEILDSQAFKGWLSELETSRKELKIATDKHEELLTQVNLLDFRAELMHRHAIDTLERANLLEDESARLANDAAQVENDSFEAVSQFEMQRTKTTELWQRLGAFDVEIEEAADPSLKKKLAKQREKVNSDYEREDARKQKLWGEVERLWVRNIAKSLELREKQRKAQIVRAEAELAFAKHETEAVQAQELRARAVQVAAERAEREHKLANAREQARERFSCLLHQDFLYWSAREDNKVVYAVPLISDKDNYVVELKPGRLYRCAHDQGVEALERITEVRSVRGKGGSATTSASAATDVSPAADVAAEKPSAEVPVTSETAAKRAEAAAKPEASGKSKKAKRKSGKSDKSEASDAADKPGVAKKSDGSDKSAGAAKSGEAESSDEAEKSDKSEKSPAAEDA